jgi:hypothetical protein
MSSISGPSGYELVPLREDLDFTLYLGRQRGNPSPILAVAPAAEDPSPQSLRRLEHEYSLAGRVRSRVGGQASSAHSSRRANNPFTE